MQVYTINQISTQLKIPKDTLRYYDKIGLLTCTREENGYRIYNTVEIHKLKYILAMKIAGFSLKEIQEIFSLTEGTPECWANLRKILKKQRQKLENKQHEIHLMIELLTEYDKTAIQQQDEEKMLYLVEKIIGGKQHE